MSVGGVNVEGICDKLEVGCKKLQGGAPGWKRPVGVEKGAGYLDAIVGSPNEVHD